MFMYAVILFINNIIYLFYKNNYYIIYKYSCVHQLDNREIQ